jgi:hypothetical protein
VDAEDYSSSGAKLTWRLINKVDRLLYQIFHGCHHKGHASEPSSLLRCHRRSESRRK